MSIDNLCMKEYNYIYINILLEFSLKKHLKSREIIENVSKRYVPAMHSWKKDAVNIHDKRVKYIENKEE